MKKLNNINEVSKKSHGNFTIPEVFNKMVGNREEDNER